MKKTIYVTKRDGQKQLFDMNKIDVAIGKCLEVDDLSHVDPIAGIVEERIYESKKDNFHVEEIQDIVIDALGLFGKDLAEKYQNYREQRTLARELSCSDNPTKVIMEIIEGKENDTTRENSNKDSKVLNTQRDLITGAYTKNIYINSIMSKEAKSAHKKGIIHVHDTDYRLMKGMTNCCIFNLKDMLEKGTVINDIRIVTPKSISTAATVATQIVLGIGNLQYGGITMSIAHLARYVRVSYNKYLAETHEQFKEAEEFLNIQMRDVDKFTKVIEKVATEKLKKEIKGAVQTIQYQLNSMTSSSGQSPFITLWLDVNEEEDYKYETALLIEEVLNQRLEGMFSKTGHNISPAFPKLIYVLDENNIKEGTEYYYLTELSAKCSSKRMTPDYISAKIMRDIKEGGLTPCMGCRSMVSPYYNSEGEYTTWGRFNIGVISINLPKIALMSNTVEDFLTNLKAYLDLVKEEQLQIADRIANTSTSVAPLLWNYGAFARLPLGSKIGQLVYNGYATASIGYAGLAETVNKFGIPYVSKEGQKLGLEIIKFMDDYCKQAKQETNLGFSLYGTPLESTTYKFAKALKEHPTIKNVNDRDYITNSYHVPVYEEMDGFTKLSMESPYQKYSAGGCISYVEVNDVSKNVGAVLDMMKYIYDHIMYAEINTRSNDVCYKCDYQGKIDNPSDGVWVCPQCGNNDRDMMSIVVRVCGYIGTNTMNIGREADVRERVPHYN